MTVLAFTHHTATRLAEVAFLLITIAGIWIVASQLQPKWDKFRTIVSGLLLTAAGVLLIIATHWGGFG